MARGLSIVPGFVDAHTHAMFAGDRRDELRRRLGRRLLRRHRGRRRRHRLDGRGHAARRRRTSSSTLTRHAARRDARVRHHDGRSQERLRADDETELKMLRVIRALAATHPVDLVADVHGRARGPASSIASRRDDYVRTGHRRDDPGGRGGRARRVVRRLLRDRRVHAGRVARILQAGARARDEAAHPRRRARRERRIAGRRRTSAPARPII